MKATLNFIRMGLAIIAYLAVLVSVIWAWGMAKRAWMSVTRTSMAERRRQNAIHIAESGAWLRHVVRAFIGLNVRVRARAGNREAISERSFVYLSNHRSALDAVLLPAALIATGDRSIRWVVKRGVLRIPFIASLMRGCGYGIVLRRKDVPDLSDDARRLLNRATMERFVRLADEEMACVGLFPEGERFVGPKPGATRAHVGDPDPGKASFRRLCADLPHHGVADVTVLWPVPPGGKTVFDALDLCDRTIDVTVEFYPHVLPEAADRFLEDLWNEKERAIAHALSCSPAAG